MSSGPRVATLDSGAEVLPPTQAWRVLSPHPRLKHGPHHGGRVYGDKQSLHRKGLHADDDPGGRITSGKKLGSGLADGLEVARCVVDDVDRELRDVGGRRSSDLQDEREVGERLPCLDAQVARADDLPRRVEGDLARDVERRAGAHRMREPRQRGERARVDVAWLRRLQASSGRHEPAGSPAVASPSASPSAGGPRARGQNDDYRARDNGAHAPAPFVQFGMQRTAGPQVKTTATAGGTLSRGAAWLRPSIPAACCAPPSHPVSITPRPPVYTSMSALPDRDRSGQARVDEPALVARALAGDRVALGTLVESYAGSVRRVTRAILGNADDADDAAQDGILAALVKLDRYDPARPFGPWLLRIAANAAIDRRRRRSVRDARVLGEDLAAADPLPDAETERLALGDRLRAALDELPEHYRLAVVLFDVEGYSHAGIAEILGLPSGTVRSAVFHARRKLRALLDDLKA